MKRVTILIVCALWLLPARPAMAGTWSWHSEVIQQIIVKILIRMDEVRNERSSAEGQGNLRGQPQSPSRVGHPAASRSQSTALPR